MNNAIPADELRKRILGCWLGKCIGGTLGGPWEGKDGPFALNFYDPVPDGMMPNDDLDLQVVWLEKLRETGGKVSCRALADAWRRHVDFHPDEYGICLKNMGRALWPPFSGEFDNPFRDGMGCAIRTELWACIAPGDPERAAALAEADGCVDHAGDGLLAARFLAALESLAFVERDRDKLLDAALGFIPADSRLARAIRDTRLWWAETGNWTETRSRILANHNPENWTDVAPNLAFIVLGWLAGGGDFGASLCAAVNCGHDADCTGATLGALLGILDPDGIPEKWKAPVGDAVVLSPGIVGMHPPRDIAAMTDEIIALAPHVKLAPAPAGTGAALVADEPLRIEAFYPAEADFVFAPGRPAKLRIRVVNPSDRIVPLEVRFATPPGWSVERSGTDVEHAFAPGEAHEETLILTAPADAPGAPRPYRDDLLLKLRSGAMEWTERIGLPRPVPCVLDGAPTELPGHDVPLKPDAPTIFSVRFVVETDGVYRINLCAPAQVRMRVDGAAPVVDVSRGTVAAVHRPTGASLNATLARGPHLLEAEIGPAGAAGGGTAPAAPVARLAIGDPGSWRLAPNLEYLP